jgi:hypothetical protein
VRKSRRQLAKFTRANCVIHSPTSENK